MERHDQWQWCSACRTFEPQILRIACVTLLLTSLIASAVSQDNTGFITIDCGGEGGLDPDTGLEWKTDKHFLDSAEELGIERVAVPAQDNPEESPRDNSLQVKTAMAFLPGRSLRSKYCYNLNITREITSNYLLRAMFPSKNLLDKQGVEDLQSYGTRFYFTVDSTVIQTIVLEKNKTQTVELVVNALDDAMYICLVPLEDRSSMAAISTLELRPLNESMYAGGRDGNGADQSNAGGGTALRTTYLMTVSRLNFGGNVSSHAVRFPNDIYDRLWYPADILANMSSEIINKRNSSIIYPGQVETFSKNIREPREVMISAWEGAEMSSELRFQFDIGTSRSSRPLQSFYLSMLLLDVDPGENSGGRFVDIDLLDSDPTDFLWAPDAVVESSPWIWYNYKQPFINGLVTFRIKTNGTSSLPAMVNAVELLGEFDAIRHRTAQDDALIINKFSDIFGNSSIVDTAGDPCLPVSWDWLVCSIDDPPRITQINLTSKGIKAELPEDFGSLDRLTVLDLSKNKFFGGLPTSLRDIVTLRALHPDENDLHGDLPIFENKSLVNVEILSLSHNRFTGSLLSLVNALDNPVSNLNLGYNNFSGEIPPIKELENLKFLDLSSNHLSGKLPHELLELPQLEILNLEGNDLTVLPDIWSYINRGSKLRSVNLNGNKLTELDLTTWLQTVLANKSFNVYPQRVTFLNNQISKVILPPQDDINDIQFCQWGRLFIAWNKPMVHNFEEYDSTNDGGDGNNKALIIGLAITGLLVLILACILAVFLGRMLKRMKDLPLAREDVRPPFYKYEDLRAATTDFAEKNELGKGAFGAVYQAYLADNSVVAVKLLFPTEQNIADFLKEMVLITGIKHRNLIQLKGCCVRDKKRMLVYEYAENGNLAQALWGSNRSFRLTWAQRLKISVGIAKGLSYLHEELQPKIIHRDIKAQNILLDKDCNPKIADFGLARPMDDTSTQRATSIGGTLGYFSPEYATQGLLTEKLDVYSYGILLLEIISGRPCINHSAPIDEVYIKNWAFRSYREGCLSKIAEESILGTVPTEEIESMARTALLCLQDDYEKRPSMSQVVSMLTGNAADVAVDIVSELKDLQHLYESLFDAQSVKKYERGETLEREDRALLNSTSSSSSSNPKGFLELSVTRAR